MKYYFNFVLFILLSAFYSQLIYSQCGQPQQPEFYFRLKDNLGANYRIFAEKYGNSPVYDYNFQATNQYDEQWERLDDFGNPRYFYVTDEYNIPDMMGFDWGTRSDAGAGCRGILGYGLYRIDIRREWEPSFIFSFYLDLRQTSWTGSPDLFFWFDYQRGTATLKVNKSGGEQRIVGQYELVELWTELGIPLNMNEIVKNSALKNDFNGNLNYDVPIILEEAENGFPLEQYNPGHSYAAGSSANFWKESYNTFRITSGVVNFSGNNFKARHWNFLEDFGNIGRVKIIGNQQTAFFKPVTSLIVNNYLEGGSGGNYDVTWQNPTPAPTTEDWQFGIAFNALKYQSPTNDLYTIKALPLDTILGTNWYFYKWNDGSTNNIKSNLQITAPTSFTAYYKGIQRSDDQNAYVNNSQRKFVRTDDGWLHSVYSSMGRVWYETSSNNGVTWTLANNGQPLDNGEGKFPSIDYSIYYGGQEDYYQVFIVFQEKSGSSSKIKVKYFQSLGGGGPYVHVNEAEVGSVQGDYSSTNTTPVIGVHSNYFTVVWKRTNDLYARAGHINIPGSITWDSGNALTGTTSNSINPTVSFSKQFYSNQKLAWEEVSGSISSIKYASLAGSQISGSIHTPSADNGFTMNYQPSIIELNGGVRLCWIAYRKGVELDGGEGSGGELPAGTTKVFFRSYSNDVWSAFNSYGNNINTVSINKNDNNTFAFAWSEGSNNVNKYVRSDNLTGIYNTNTSGKYLQVGNFANLNSMKLNSFTTSTTPYSFSLSNTFQIIAEEEEIDREGLIVQDTTAFYFALGSIKVNDETIDFIELPDTLMLNYQEDINSYLISQPFSLTESSNFTYGVKYGVTDSLSAASALSDGRFVQFKVELIDDQTSDVLGTFDNVTFNSENIIPYESRAYQVNLQGIGNRSCRLRLVTTDDIEFNYSLANSYNNETLLAKKGYKEISLNSSAIITEYALEQNYPNPFNPSTTIRYQISNDGLVTLKVYDLLGSEVATLINEHKTTGRYEVNFDSSRLASGVYIYKLQAGNFVQTKKMILIR